MYSTTFKLELVMILVIMYVKTFKDDVVFISIKHHNMTSLRPIISSIRVNPLIMTITLVEIKGKMSNLPKVESIYLEPVLSKNVVSTVLSASHNIKNK
jgi:hypothetical protein